MTDIILQSVLNQIKQSPTELSKKNIDSIKKLFPIPCEYRLLWANVKFGARISGVIITDKAIIIKADPKTVKDYNKACKEKKERQNSIYYLIKWEYFDADDFEVHFQDGQTILSYHQSIAVVSERNSISSFFKCYKSEIEKIAKASVTVSANVFSDFESVVPANFAKVNTKTGHGEMAEEALTLLDKMAGKDAVVVGRTNKKDGADRLVDGVQIQTKYADSGRKCISDCFDKTTGAFRYFNPDGTPMQIEVPSDKYYEAINTFRAKILEGKVPGVTNPDDAYKYIRKGKLTYQQALNLCKPGTIESLTYDAATGFVCCSFALGISFLTTYVICFTQTGNKKESLNAALVAGIQVFGLSFVGHILASQIARTTLTKQLIPLSTYLVKSLGFKATQNIVNAIRAMSGKAAISGAAATKQLAKILRSNAITSIITFAVFSVPDTYNMFSRKISGAQYTKNMLSLIGTMASAGGGTLAASIGAAKIGAATGTTIHPGIGTAIGVGGGLIGGAIGGTAVKALGDKIREDDSIILSRMFNGVLLNLIYEYMLQETEIDVLIEKLNSIKTKEFKKLFKDLISAKSQDKTIDNFVRHYFEEIIRSRPVIAEPSADDLVELLKQFDTDIDITANTP